MDDPKTSEGMIPEWNKAGKRSSKSPYGSINIEFFVKEILVQLREGFRKRKCVKCVVKATIFGGLGVHDTELGPEEGVAVCNPKDKFDLEMGKDVSFKKACKKFPYVGFRRNARAFYFYPTALDAVHAMGLEEPPRPIFYPFALPLAEPGNVSEGQAVSINDAGEAVPTKSDSTYVGEFQKKVDAGAAQRVVLAEAAINESGQGVFVPAEKTTSTDDIPTSTPERVEGYLNPSSDEDTPF
jgi:hypothetical protein